MIMISFGSPHALPIGVPRTCGEPNKFELTAGLMVQHGTALGRVTTTTTTNTVLQALHKRVEGLEAQLDEGPVKESVTLVPCRATGRHAPPARELKRPAAPTRAHASASSFFFPSQLRA